MIVDLLLIAQLVAASTGEVGAPGRTTDWSLSSPAWRPASHDPEEGAAAEVPPVDAEAESAGETPAPPPAVRQATVFHDRLVVVAERRPTTMASSAAAVSTLSADLLARLPVASAADAVALLTGFEMLSASPFGGVPMEVARGFFGGGEAGYVQLRIDGVPLSDAETGVADWAASAAPAIERIEALRGTASPLYGDTALGGVVELITRRAGEGPRVAAEATAGSFVTRSGHLHLTGGGERLAAALSLDLRESDGFREHGASERAGGRLRLDGAVGENEWSLAVATGHHRRREPGPLSFAEIAEDRRAANPLFRFDGEDERRWTGSASWRRAATAVGEARLWRDARSSEGIRSLLLAEGFADRAARRVEAVTTGLSVVTSGGLPHSGGGEWTLGAELAHEELSSRYRDVGEDGRRGSALAAVSGERRRYGAFASLGVDAGERLRLTGGARWDGIDERFPGGGVRDAWSPRAGAVLRPIESRPWVAFASWSRSFKAPTPDQLFDPRPLPDGAGGTFRLANPDLLPQRAATLEAGLRGFGPGASWHLTAYRTAVEREIDFDPLSFRYLNLGATLHRGVEVAGEVWRGRRGLLSAGWEWSEVFPRSGPEAGQQLKNVPRHSGRLVGVARLPLRIDAGLALRHLAGRHLDDAHRFPLPDATSVDLRLSRPFGPFELRIDLFNLLDDDLRSVGLAVPSLAGGEVPYAFPGHPRSFLVGVRWTRGDEAEAR